MRMLRRSPEGQERPGRARRAHEDPRKATKAHEGPRRATKAQEGGHEFGRIGGTSRGSAEGGRERRERSANAGSPLNQRGGPDLSRRILPPNLWPANATNAANATN